MKKKISLIFIIILICCIALFCLFKLNEKQNTDNSIQNNSISESGESVDFEKKIIDLGSLVIPKINVEAPLKEGVSLDVLDSAVGHFENTALYDGNVCFAGHNYGENKDFFKDLHLLEIGDEIYYNNVFGSFKYKVSKIQEIEQTDLSVLNSTENDILTLITCVKGKSQKRLCVVAEKDNSGVF